MPVYRFSCFTAHMEDATKVWSTHLGLTFIYLVRIQSFRDIYIPILVEGRWRLTTALPPAKRLSLSDHPT